MQSSRVLKAVGGYIAGVVFVAVFGVLLGDGWVHATVFAAVLLALSLGVQRLVRRWT